jgi:kynurenine 3-monooxygenase
MSDATSPSKPSSSGSVRQSKERIVVVGAGPVGSLLAIFLARRGHRVEVYERSPDTRNPAVAAVHRSSINLSLCNRGVAVLDQVGLGQTAIASSVPAYGRLIHGVDGSLTNQPYGSKGERTFSILRNGLGNLLVDHAEAAHGVPFHFNERCLDVDLATGTLRFENTVTGEVHDEPASRVLAADGIFSTVRARLQRTMGFNYQQRFLDEGYREITIPADAPYSWMREREKVHLWPRGGFLLLGLPNPDGSFVCSLFLPHEGPRSFASLTRREDLLALLTEAFPDVFGQSPELADQFFAKTTNYLATVRCHPWVHGDRIALVGDSAHAVVPFYAQGVNCGFEDCLAFDQALERHGDDWGAVLRSYQDSRKVNADAISDLSLQHFLELRDLVGQARFQLRKRLEARLCELYPDRFVPVYNLVTFTTTPYSEAQRVGRHQAEVFERLLGVPNIETKTGPELDHLVGELLAAT